MTIHSCFSPRYALMGLAALFAFGVGAQPAEANHSLRTRQQLVDLMLCYARGTDAIGDSTRADPAGDGADIYSECFTDDAVFRAWFPGTDFSDESQAVTVGPGDGQTGPEAWAGFVFSVFDGTYTFTQHSLSNFDVKVKGRHAMLEAYLNAAHVAQDGEAVTQVDVAHGTYRLKIKKIRGRWRVKQLELRLINFTPFFQN